MDYPDGVREAALAHKYKNETMAAYQQGEKLEKRRTLMNDWARYASDGWHTLDATHTRRAEPAMAG